MGEVPATKDEENPSYSKSKGEDEVSAAKEQKQPSFPPARGNTVHLTPAAIPKLFKEKKGDDQMKKSFHKNASSFNATAVYLRNLANPSKMSGDNVPAKKCSLKTGVISAKEAAIQFFEAQLEAIKSEKHKSFGEVFAPASPKLSREVPVFKASPVRPIEVPVASVENSSSEQKTCQENDGNLANPSKRADDNVPAKKCILKPGVISAKESACQLFKAQLEAIKSQKYKDFGEVTARASSNLSRDVPVSKVLLVCPEVPELLAAGKSTSDVDSEELKTCQQNEATMCTLKPGVISAAEAGYQQRQKHKEVTAPPICTVSRLHGLRQSILLF